MKLLEDSIYRILRNFFPVRLAKIAQKYQENYRKKVNSRIHRVQILSFEGFFEILTFSETQPLAILTLHSPSLKMHKKHKLRHVKCDSVF